MDDLFFSPLEGPRLFLHSRLPKILSDVKFAIVSAVFLLKPIKYTDKPAVEYLQYFCPNIRAVYPFPEVVQTGLSAGNDTPERA